MSDFEFIDLDELLSFNGFNWKRYSTGETEILQPQLEKMGYSNFRWVMGEYDSFGPLTRVCHMTNSDGEQVRGIYG